MAVSVTMPQLGESVTEGTITRWLKHEGDRVEVDEPLLEVSTDKVDTEIPSPAAGTLTRIVVPEDETAEVGSELALIDGDGAAAGGGEPAAAAESSPAEPTDAEVPEAQPAPQQSDQQPGQPAQQPAQQPAEQAVPPRAQPQAEPQAQQAAQQLAGGTGDAGTDTDGGTDGGTDSGTVVNMPALGESVTEGTITRWLKQIGDPVEMDEPLLEVSTDKVDTEIPSPAAGTLVEIKVNEDETAEVGSALAVIGGAGGQVAQEQPEAPEPAPVETAAAPPVSQPSAPKPAAPPQAAPAPARPAPPQAAPAPAPPATATPPAQPATPAEPAPAAGGYVTPLVRKLAADHGVDLGSLQGTGVGGRIRKQDVLDAAERQKAAAPATEPAAAPAPARGEAPAEAPSPLRGRTEKLSRMRQIIAQRMVEALQTAAQLTTVVEVDVTRIARLRDEAKADFQKRHDVKLSFLSFFTLAAVEALRVHPKVNASIDTQAGTVTYHDAEHLGLAVDTDRGLMLPVIHNAGDLNLAGLARRIADLAERTRSGKITPDEVSGATFTLTNTGSRGALFDTPIVPQPQVAMLGTGAVVKRAVVVDDPQLGEIIVPRSMVYLALSYDHRLIDGADAARFLATVKERLEAAKFESELGLG